MKFPPKLFENNRAWAKKKARRPGLFRAAEPDAVAGSSAKSADGRYGETIPSDVVGQMEKELEISMLAGMEGNKTTFALTFFNRAVVTRGTLPKSTHVVDA